MTDFSDLPTDDQQAIGKTLQTLLTAFRDRDAEALQAVYSDDADWVVGDGTLDRDNFLLRALQLIVSEMFQDANTETTYAQ